MCGRFSLIQVKDLEKRFDFVQLELEFEPRFNIAPSQSVPVVVRENDRNYLRMFRWGLIPSWAKDEHLGSKMINARGETLSEKPSFRKSFEQKRCLVLADGFYEWKKEGRIKAPYRITLQDGKPFAFAGLWDTWLSPSGQRINSCTIITTASNKLMETIHQRMPVILPADKESLWLNVEASSSHDVQGLLTPYPSEQMVAYEVLPYVNSPSYEGPECVMPVNKLF
ncbi:putative SOS response-associated peptidase YedK [Desulfosporosinus acididurans]|uniref:Abasic site processing protein n=1 Tax=Desulfosporosinus acididurans TaxID=476652 RepID=A0A0J1FVR3_9FIRM|nr:SOS response-associated peptidase [Desulfosporosinus acididurans]KLU67402.1 putative SOS response-associated peptidase YedK [Desulfosporosinus acididurans]